MPIPTLKTSPDATTFPSGPRVALRRIEFHATRETISAEFPFRLITGRIPSQFNAGTICRAADGVYRGRGAPSVGGTRRRAGRLPEVAGQCSSGAGPARALGAAMAANLSDEVSRLFVT